LIPLLLKFDLAADWRANGFSYEAALAVLTTTVGIAGLVWGSIITAWGGLKRHRVYAIVIPMLIAGLAQVGLGLSRWLYISAAMIFLLVGMGAVMGAHMAAIWQTQTPREMQGRVSAFRRVIVQASAPLGTALAGLAAGMLDPGLLVAIFGSLIVLYCAAQLFNSQLRHVEDKEYLDRMAEK
jgi:MFS family permease